MSTVFLPEPISTIHRPQATTSLTLVSMPWAPLDSPYLALATLDAYVAANDPSRVTFQEHAYLDWYRLLQDEFGKPVARRIYANVAETGAYSGVGDFIFADYAFPQSPGASRGFPRHL